MFPVALQPDGVTLLSHAHRQVVVSQHWVEFRAGRELEAASDLWKEPLPRYLSEIKAADNYLPTSVEWGPTIMIKKALFHIINLIT